MIPQRFARELVYQLEHARRDDRLADALSTIPVFMSLFNGETFYEVLRLWTKLERANDIESAYRIGLDRWRPTADPLHEGIVTKSVADLMERVGRWDVAAELYQRVIAIAERIGDRAGAGEGHRGLGIIRVNQGRYDQAIAELTIARSIADRLGDRNAMSRAIGAMGKALYSRGDYDRALECFRDKEEICRQIGDRVGAAIATGNIGNIFLRRGQHERALECHRMQESISREKGDRRGMAYAIGNQGNVHSARGEHHRAMELYQREEAICNEIGDQGGLAIVTGNMGVVFQARGEYDRALQFYGRQEAICRRIGDVRLAALALGNAGSVYHHLGTLDRALECYDRAVTELRQIGNSRDVALWLAEFGHVLVDIVELPGGMPEFLRHFLPAATEQSWRCNALERARLDAMECIAISEQFGNDHNLFTSRILLARVDFARDNAEIASERLAGMLEHAIDDNQRAELHYWLWRFGMDNGETEIDPGRSGPAVHRAEAERLYRDLHARTPKQSYLARIDELRAVENRA